MGMLHEYSRNIYFPSGKACNFIKKKSLAQVFSCEFCEISKNTFFYRIPPVAASVITLFNVNDHQCKHREKHVG